jgi:AraC family transcriptional activator of mtrCDE
MILICGYFRARYGANVELFSDLMTPIVEQFDESHHLDVRLKTALAELMSEEVGAGAMSNALLKQVLVTLLRRSLSSMNLWVERFSALSDPQIARAFADMVARPGAPHSLKSLAQTAGLSRTLFAERFTRLFGKAPMATLRDLRMRQAVALLNCGEMSMDQLAEDCGYSARTSFLRAFQAVHGATPSGYLKRLRDSIGG